MSMHVYMFLLEVGLGEDECENVKAKIVFYSLPIIGNPISLHIFF